MTSFKKFMTHVVLPLVPIILIFMHCGTSFIGRYSIEYISVTCNNHKGGSCDEPVTTQLDWCSTCKGGIWRDMGRPVTCAFHTYRLLAVSTPILAAAALYLTTHLITQQQRQIKKPRTWVLATVYTGVFITCILTLIPPIIVFYLPTYFQLASSSNNNINVMPTCRNQYTGQFQLQCQSLQGHQQFDQFSNQLILNYNSTFTEYVQDYSWGLNSSFIAYNISCILMVLLLTISIIILARVTRITNNLEKQQQQDSKERPIESFGNQTNNGLKNSTSTLETISITILPDQIDQSSTPMEIDQHPTIHL